MTENTLKAVLVLDLDGNREGIVPLFLKYLSLSEYTESLKKSNATSVRYFLVFSCTQSFPPNHQPSRTMTAAVAPISPGKKEQGKKRNKHPHVSLFNGKISGNANGHPFRRISWVRSVCCQRRGGSGRTGRGPASVGSWRTRRRISGSRRLSTWRWLV